MGMQSSDTYASFKYTLSKWKCLKMHRFKQKGIAVTTGHNLKNKLKRKQRDKQEFKFQRPSAVASFSVVINDLMSDTLCLLWWAVTKRFGGGGRTRWLVSPVTVLSARCVLLLLLGDGCSSLHCILHSNPGNKMCLSQKWIKGHFFSTRFY